MLTLIRHGNTFESHQNPVMVGGRTDMPLTAKGLEQAAAAGEHLSRIAGKPTEISAGPLLRTRVFAEKIAARLGIPAVIRDDRLKEIDYGLWEGLDSASIAQKFGATEIEGWEKSGQWPESAQWSPSRAELVGRLEDFLAEKRRKLSAADGENLIAVTSNGILRMIYSLITKSPPDTQSKVGTGCVCFLIPAVSGWEIKAWNEKPLSMNPELRVP